MAIRKAYSKTSMNGYAITMSSGHLRKAGHDYYTSSETSPDSERADALTSDQGTTSSRLASCSESPVKLHLLSIHQRWHGIPFNGVIPQGSKQLKLFFYA